jgi:hypothetical protein
VLDGRFDLLGCSPRFLVDWRWYKQSPSGLGWVTEAYWTQAHNLYDYRVVEPARAPAANQRLSSRCQQARDALRAYEATGQDDPRLSQRLDPGWFGRGQQYLSFVKR